MADGVIKPVLGRLDQGTIFSCAVAEDYPGTRTYGLVITARCDVDRDRAPVINYLPVVHMDGWIHRDGSRILRHRARSETQGALGVLLRRLGHAPSVLETEALGDVYAKLLQPLPDKKHKQDKEAFLAHASALELLAPTTPASAADLDLTKKLSTRFDPMCRGIATELTRQTLNGYYFLPQVDPNGDSHGYVVLLREVRHIPRVLSQRVADGMTSSEYSTLCNKDATLSDRLSFAVHDFACPLGQLSSPRLEHLMQLFALLFSRIGVDDPPPQHGSNTWHSQPSLQEHE